MKETPFLIVGGDQSDSREIVEILEPIMGPTKTYFTCSALEAEVIKYMENSFFATKVTFVNEFFNICQALGANWYRVREGWLLDPRINKMHPWYWAAASIILLLGTALWISMIHYDRKNDLLTYKTGDFINEIVLSDGSQICLNKHSKLITPEIFLKNRRNVTIEGEAFFEVKKDISRPFRIKAGKTTTEVSGTSFNIDYNKETGNVNIIVTTGKVAFYKRNSLYIIIVNN